MPESTTPCPVDEAFVAFSEGRLNDVEREAFYAHIDQCSSCQSHWSKLVHSRGSTGAEPRAGDAIGPYFLVERVGGGGMGVVFRAHDRRLDRVVALKFLASSLATDPKALARFQRETRIVAAIDHPGVAHVYAVGEHAGRPYFVMPFYDGETLRERSARGLVEPLAAARLLSQIADALGAAHTQGIVHRDVKPSNVLVTTDGEVRLVDFGLAKLPASDSLTASGELLGTLAYLAPEQHVATPADARSDVWALGVVGYELLAGALPFAATSTAQLIQAVRDDEPPKLVRGPFELHLIIARCLEKEPARRYPDARAVAADLGRLLDGRPVQARPAGAAERARRWALRRVGGLVAAALAAAALVSAGYGVWTRVTAARRGARLRRIVESAQQMRDTMRREILLPFHDTTPRRALLRDELTALEREVHDSPDPPQGPESLALGWGGSRSTTSTAGSCTCRLRTTPASAARTSSTGSATRSRASTRSGSPRSTTVPTGRRSRRAFMRLRSRTCVPPSACMTRCPPGSRR
jgi:hypothetical protein